MISTAEQDAVRRKVAASRATQGLPETVTDPATLERVAAIMRLVPAPPSPRCRRRKTAQGAAGT